MPFTRFVHVVRCYGQGSSGNSGTFVDVMVTDKFAVQGTNGQGFKVDVTAANAVPTINDYTGDYGSVDNGDNATRQTHIIRVTSDTDPSQYIDVEVLDAFCLTGVNNQQWIGKLPALNATTFVETINGPDIGTLVSPEETLVTSSPGSTRWANVNELGNNVAQQVTYPLPVSPPPGALGSGPPFMAVEEFQKISFMAPNGQGWKFDLSDPNQQINDTTSYLTDANTGNLYPPQNTDPDPYVIFPTNPPSSGPWTGNTVVSQGPLWRIINASGSNILTIYCYFSVYDAQCTMEIDIAGYPTTVIFDSSSATGGQALEGLVKWDAPIIDDIPIGQTTIVGVAYLNLAALSGPTGTFTLTLNGSSAFSFGVEVIPPNWLGWSDLDPYNLNGAASGQWPGNAIPGTWTFDGHSPSPGAGPGPPITLPYSSVGDIVYSFSLPTYSYVGTWPSGTMEVTYTPPLSGMGDTYVPFYIALGPALPFETVGPASVNVSVDLTTFACTLFGADPNSHYFTQPADPVPPPIPKLY